MYWSTDEHPDQRGDVWWRMTCRLQMLRRGRRRGVADYIIPGTCFSNKYISKRSAVGSPRWIVDTQLWKLRDALCMPIFFFMDLGLALAPKCVPTNHRPLRRPIRVKRLPFPGAPRDVCTKVSANIRRTDCARPILSNIWRPKSNLHWIQVIAIRSGGFCTSLHKSPKVHAVFER